METPRKPPQAATGHPRPDRSPCASQGSDGPADRDRVEVLGNAEGYALVAAPNYWDGEILSYEVLEETQSAVSVLRWLRDFAAQGILAGERDRARARRRRHGLEGSARLRSTRSYAPSTRQAHTTRCSANSTRGTPTRLRPCLQRPGGDQLQSGHVDCSEAAFREERRLRISPIGAQRPLLGNVLSALYDLVGSTTAVSDQPARLGGTGMVAF